MAFDYVTVTKAAYELGLSPAAIRAKIYRGDWREGVEFERGPDRRIYIKKAAIKEWIESKNKPA